MSLLLSRSLPSESLHKFDVINPTNGQVIANVCDMEQETILSIIDKAVSAQEKWSKLPHEKRAIFLSSWHKLILENIDELAEIISLENGKVHSDAKSEVLYGASFVEWFAKEALLKRGELMEGAKPGQKILINYEPVGVVAAITPWNFPSAMITRKIAPALAAGCVVILKPSELTPLSALALEYLAKKAGFPEGVINIVTSKDSTMIGKAFCDDFRIRKISFTGSTAVGKILYEQSGKTLKRISLELGGNAPFIICADADIEYVVKCLVSAKIRSSSQACTSPNRIFIHDSIYEAVTEKLADAFCLIEPGKDIGPLINQKAVDKALHLIGDAVKQGAKVLCGEKVRAGTYFEPCVLIDCKDEMDIFSNEIFAPVLACYKFSSIDEVIARANNTEYGLASYIFSKDQETLERLSSGLDFGMVGVNTAMVSNSKGAFAGRKASGFGVEGGHLGIYEFLNTKYLCVE